MEVIKVKIDGDECMSSSITWALKTPKTTNLRVAQIQTNVEAFV